MSERQPIGSVKEEWTGDGDFTKGGLDSGQPKRQSRCLGCDRGLSYQALRVGEFYKEIHFARQRNRRRPAQNKAKHEKPGQKLDAAEDDLLASHACDTRKLRPMNSRSALLARILRSSRSRRCRSVQSWSCPAVSSRARGERPLVWTNSEADLAKNRWRHGSQMTTPIISAATPVRILFARDIMLLEFTPGLVVQARAGPPWPRLVGVASGSGHKATRRR